MKQSNSRGKKQRIKKRIDRLEGKDTEPTTAAVVGTVE